jgi:hypothetical protein
MPLIIGSTTANAAETATAASKAFPPSLRTSSPACVASGWAELTTPFVPTAGRFAVFLLAGPSTGSDTGFEVAGPVLSPVKSAGVVVRSEEEASSPVVPAREALSLRALDWTLQEHKSPTSNATRRILLKKRLQEARSH